MHKNSGFTLVEVLVAVALTGVILLTGYSSFQRVMQAQARLGATIDIQKNLFYTNEKLATLIREGGTIDYEEYFNRRMLRYDQGPRSDGIFTFTTYSHFGNGDTTGTPSIYYCGTTDLTTLTAETCLESTSPGFVYTDKINGTFTSPFLAGQQPYGQYAALVLNYLDPVGYPVGIKLPPIFKTDEKVQIFDRGVNNGVYKLVDKNATDVGLPELYLIKRNIDGTYERTYFRHVYIDEDGPTGSGTCSPTTSLDGCLGKIQMTKLISCDSLVTGGSPGSDGVIDAWIPQCDFLLNGATSCSAYCEFNNNTSGCISYRTTCPTTSATIYTSAHEEDISGSTANLAWVDVTSPDMNVVRATFLPSPLKIPSLMSGAGDDTKAAQVSLYLEVTLSTRLRNKSFVLPAYNYPRTLITTYDLSE